MNYKIIGPKTLKEIEVELNATDWEVIQFSFIPPGHAVVLLGSEQKG